MAGYDQQDAHEFLIALLDGLAQHLERYHKQAPPTSSHVKAANGAGGGGGVVDLTTSSDVGSFSGSSGSSSGSNSSGMVSQVFLGVLHSRVACMSCGNSSSKQDPILDVSLSLEALGWGDAEAGADLTSTGAPKDPFAPISLRDCLRFFTSKETLSEMVACGWCNQHCPAQKSLSFAVAPHTLVLHLKRFDAINQRKVCLPLLLSFSSSLLLFCSFIHLLTPATYRFTPRFCSTWRAST
jgi:ubiquitin C-terminal hydrolase